MFPLLVFVDRAAIVAAEEPERIGQRALSLARRSPILGLRRARDRFTGGGGGAILAEMEAHATEPFVGRARELAELDRALEAAQNGSGLTVLIAGEAGIGKTRLASQLARRARAAGFDVLLGRSIDLVGTELPFQPFVEALRPLGAVRQIARPPAGSQLRIFEETLALLTERATDAPVLLVLEDLHWADTSTLDLLLFLTHNLHDRQVLLLATYRADDALLGRADAPIRRRRPALGGGDAARARAARARRPGGAARGPRGRPGAGGGHRLDSRPLRR